MPNHVIRETGLIQCCYKWHKIKKINTAQNPLKFAQGGAGSLEWIQSERQRKER